MNDNSLGYVSAGIMLQFVNLIFIETGNCIVKQTTTLWMTSFCCKLKRCPELIRYLVSSACSVAIFKHVLVCRPACNCSPCNQCKQLLYSLRIAEWNGWFWKEGNRPLKPLKLISSECWFEMIVSNMKSKNFEDSTESSEIVTNTY